MLILAVHASLSKSRWNPLTGGAFFHTIIVWLFTSDEPSTSSLGSFFSSTFKFNPSQTFNENWIFQWKAFMEIWEMSEDLEI